MKRLLIAVAVLMALYSPITLACNTMRYEKPEVVLPDFEEPKDIEEEEELINDENIKEKILYHLEV